MPPAFPSLIDVVFRPAVGWDAVRAANPRWWRSLLVHALPLALLPAFAWPLGQGLRGAAALASFAATLVFSMTSVLLLAAGLYALAGFFRALRDWDRSVAVAAYAATPVFLCGALLFVPVLVVAGLLGLMHCFVLTYVGVQTVLGCRASSAAEFTASAGVFAFLGSLVVGALCSAAGLI